MDTLSDEPGQASRARSAFRMGRILATAGVLAAAPMVTGFPQVSTQVQAHPVKDHIRQVGFVKTSVASMRASRDATHSAESTPGEPDPITAARSGAVAPVQGVAGAVTVVGVTWPRGAVTAGDQYQIRTLTGATWSQWQSLAVEQADGPDRAEAATAARAATGGTSPYVVTGASKYEVRSLSTDPAAPTAAKVQVIDPGTSGADSVQSPGSAPGAAAAATAKPAIFTRAQWGANEALRKAAPVYGQVLLGFVHHTDSANSYSATSVPAMIRGIYAYHVQTLGWNDIGYNFLVDRFGRTWEGRYGGMTKAVVGAQTLNYNAVSTGVSAIGNYDIAPVPQAMTDAFKRVLAWRLSVAGKPAIGTVVANGKSFQRISGHRDGFQTACPGRYLYAKLPEIRAGAAALIALAPKSAPTPAPAPAPQPAPAPPVNHAPLGSLDSAVASPGKITVKGWALDPDTTLPIRVHIYVDGKPVISLGANGARPDVGRVYGKGNNHGFGSTMNALAGTHQVCAWAINTPVGPNLRLPCKSVTLTNHAPTGHLDLLTSGMDRLTVRGWALDLDTASAVNVHVYVDGKLTAVLAAAGSRPDVGRALGQGDNHGFNSTVSASAGTHQVCVYAIDSWGGANPKVGCASVDVNGSAIGHIESATGSRGGVTVRGWALDPNTTSPINVHVHVDGRFKASFAAAGSRPDVGRVYGKGNNHGFISTVSASAGTHQVCVWAMDSAGGTNPPIGCTSVTVP